MSEKEEKAGRGFDPAGVDALLETGGGLLGDVLDEVVEEWEQADIERWIGVQTGAYRIENYLNRGGMSLVFSAERSDGQFEQRVAVKVLRTADAGDLIARFEQERRLLARLEHPGIARIIDSGVVDGRPWIAMELVNGEPIDVYCDRNQLGLDQRLGLFTQIARAVQFAHGRLIVHRDLKPSNILVNAEGHPKLLDFGIAKVLQPETDNQGTHAVALLTPQYASPEQVLGDPVGVASDIYQLGLLLYQLLTGCNAQAIGDASIARIKAAVVDEEPLSPSSIVDTTGQNDAKLAEKIAQARSTSLSRLRKSLSGDLDAIVHQCLEKEPSSRYVTVLSLIEDIEAYREMRPVKARVPGSCYRAGRFVKRHRGSVLSGVLTLAVLVGAVAGLAMSWRSTIAAQSLALEEAAAAKQVGDFLADMLEEANPNQSGGAEQTVRELLDATAGRLDSLRNRPRVHARLLEVIADAYQTMYLPDVAEPLARKALSIREQLGDAAALVDPLAILAAIRMQQNELDDALQFGERAVAIAQNAAADPMTGATAHDTLSVILFQRGAYVEERLQIQAAIAAIAAIENDQTRVMRANFLMKLGSNSKQLGEYNRALAEFEAALNLLGEQPGDQNTRMFALRDLGSLHSYLGDEDLAIEMLGQSLDLARTVYGNDSANLLGNLVLLGRSLRIENRNAEAEAMFKEALTLAEATIGKEHGNYARVLHDYSLVILARGDFLLAREVSDEAGRIADAAFGANHSTAVNLRKARALLDLSEGLYPQAVRSLQAILPDVRAAFGDQHIITFETEAALAEALLASGSVSAARDAMLALIEKGLRISDGRFNPNLRNQTALSGLYRLTGPLDEALRYADQAVQLRQQMDGGQRTSMFYPLSARIQVLSLARDGRAAEDIARALALLASMPGRSMQLHAFLTDFAAGLSRGGYLDEADMLCGPALQALVAALPDDQPRLAYARTDCGEVAIRAGKIAQATTLLNSAVPVVVRALGADSWRSQWALALQATANRRTGARAIALSKLKSTLGEESPLILSLPEIP